MKGNLKWGQPLKTDYQFPFIIIYLRILFGSRRRAEREMQHYDSPSPKGNGWGVHLPRVWKYHGPFAQPGPVLNAYGAHVFGIDLHSCKSLLRVERVLGVVRYGAAACDQHVVSNRDGLRDREYAAETALVDFAQREKFSINAEATFHSSFALQTMIDACMDLYRNTPRV